jgi:DNA-binding NarL/FixJ family response regulator
MLNYTRKQILNKEFCVEVEACNALTGLPEILSRGPLDLLLLCQSVLQEECVEVIEKVRAESPAAKVLVLHESFSGVCSVQPDATMDSLEGPPALLHEIHALLEMAASQNEIAGESYGSKIASFNGSPSKQARRPA